MVKHTKDSHKQTVPQRCLRSTNIFDGKLGDDEFGHMLAGILMKNGVADQGINFDTGARTALAFVTLRADGDREFMFYRNPSADMLLRPDELNLELIRSIESLGIKLLAGNRSESDDLCAPQTHHKKSTKLSEYEEEKGPTDNEKVNKSTRETYQQA